jgi:hypothetical protein
MDNQGRNQQFKCEIVDGKLTISIGLDVLAHALQIAIDAVENGAEGCELIDEANQ